MGYRRAIARPGGASSAFDLRSTSYTDSIQSLGLAAGLVLAGLFLLGTALWAIVRGCCMQGRVQSPKKRVLFALVLAIAFGIVVAALAVGAWIASKQLQDALSASLPWLQEIPARTEQAALALQSDAVRAAAGLAADAAVAQARETKAAVAAFRGNVDLYERWRRFCVHFSGSLAFSSFFFTAALAALHPPWLAFSALAVTALAGGAMWVAFGYHLALHTMLADFCEDSLAFLSSSLPNAAAATFAGCGDSATAGLADALSAAAAAALPALDPLAGALFALPASPGLFLSLEQALSEAVPANGTATAAARASAASVRALLDGRLAAARRGPSPAAPPRLTGGRLQRCYFAVRPLRSAREPLCDGRPSAWGAAEAVAGLEAAAGIVLAFLFAAAALFELRARPAGAEAPGPPPAVEMRAPPTAPPRPASAAPAKRGWRLWPRRDVAVGRDGGAGAGRPGRPRVVLGDNGALENDSFTHI